MYVCLNYDTTSPPPPPPPPPPGLVDGVITSQPLVMASEQPTIPGHAHHSQTGEGIVKPKDLKDKKAVGKGNRVGKKSSVSEEQRQVKEKERRSANNQRERLVVVSCLAT